MSISFEANFIKSTEKVKNSFAPISRYILSVFRRKENLLHKKELFIVKRNVKITYNYIY